MFISRKELARIYGRLMKAEGHIEYLKNSLNGYAGRALENGKELRALMDYLGVEVGYQPREIVAKKEKKHG